LSHKYAVVPSLSPVRPSYLDSNGSSQSVTFLFILKYFFEWDVEYPGYFEGKFYGRYILRLLEGDDRLAGASGTISQFFLGHFVVIES
jgi:hypothetical protein